MGNLSGKTPLLRIRYRLDGTEGAVWAKLESYNPTGSIKDRIAVYILDKAMERGELKKGQPIVEMTSGNTGISFAAQGALRGHPVHIFMPDWASQERKTLMAMYGATLHPVSAEEGGFKGALEGARRLAKELGAFEPRQFENPDNPMAHAVTTGEELLRELPDVTDFVSGVGSGGTLMGVARRLKADHPVRAAAVEPDVMALLSGGAACGNHHIEGIADSFIPKVIDPALIDNIWDLCDLDAVLLAARLAKELGLGVGISSGANFLGAVLQNAQGKPGERVVSTVFADDNKKYLTTLLADPAPRPADAVSNRIELLDVDAK